MSPPPTWRDVLAGARAAVGSDLDARRLVERASGYPGAGLATHLDEEAPARALDFLDAMVQRRLAGEPLQYVVGIWGFRSLDLLVDHRVLIPRPETEMIVEVALGELGRLRRAGRAEPGLVADLGTGSGAIALSIATEDRRARVWATDASTAALAVARANLAGTGSGVAPRVRLAEGSWFEALPGELRGRLDVVVSNPPYVGTSEQLPAEVAAWEPRQALVAGPAGTEAIADIVDAVPEWLSPGGAVVLELAPSQAREAMSLAGRSGLTGAEIRQDLAGRDRVLVARRAT